MFIDGSTQVAPDEWTDEVGGEYTRELRAEWEIYPVRMFDERAVDVPQLPAFLSIASAGDYVFVSLNDSGVAVWHHDAPDRFTCMGVFRVPLWGAPGELRLSPPVRDLHVFEWEGSRFLAAALTNQHHSVQSADALRPRAFIWELTDDASMAAAADAGLDGADLSSGIPIDGVWSGVWAAPGRAWMLLHPVGALTGVAARTHGTGVTTSVVDGSLRLWVETMVAVDAWDISAIAASSQTGAGLNDGSVEHAVALDGDTSLLRILTDDLHIAGIGYSAGPLKCDVEVGEDEAGAPLYEAQATACGAPVGAPVTSAYCQVEPRFKHRPSAAGRLAMGGMFSSVGPETWLMGLSSAPLTSPQALARIGAMQRFLAARGAMFEMFARFYWGVDDGGSQHFFFGPARSHLGRVDLRIPAPDDMVAIDSAVAAMLNDNTLTPGQALQPSNEAPCAVDQSIGGGMCEDPEPACGSTNGAISTSRYLKPRGQVQVAYACPGTPVVTPANPLEQNPWNSCAVFADDGLPPLVSWGYGGEWLDAHSVESDLGGWVVFLADRASGAIYAHRSGLRDGKGLDAFPGYDPRSTATGIWPPAPTAAAPVSFTDYWPGRNRIPNCRSVSSMPWPWNELLPVRTFDLGGVKISPVGGSDDKRPPGTLHNRAPDRSDKSYPPRLGSIGPQPPGRPPGGLPRRGNVAAALVAAVGPSDPVASVFLCPFEWLDAPSGTSGEFLYSDPVHGPFETRFPLLEAGESPEGVVSALTVRAMVWPPSAFAKESEELFVVGLGGTFDTRWDLAVIEPKSVTLSTRPALRDPADMVVHWWRMPRDPTGGFGPGSALKPLHNRGVQELHLLDVRDAGSRLYVLMEDTRDDEEGGWWLVTLAKDVDAASPNFDVLYVQELDTTHRRQEIQRLKVSPDHRWLAVTFGSTEGGVMVLYVPEEHGALGQPEVVAGLRRVQVNNVVRWQGWRRDVSPSGFEDLNFTYDSFERGQGGVPLIPAWPVPESSVQWLDIKPSEQVDLEATSAEFLQTDSGMLLSVDTDPISIWRLVPEDAATTDCPLRFLGCLPSEQSQRMRVAWRTPHGVSHLGDRGSWTWATCQPDWGSPCPVQPDPFGP